MLTTGVELGLEQLLAIDNMAQSITKDTGGFQYRPFKPDNLYTAVEHLDSPFIDLPEAEILDHNCVPLAVYYAARYLGFDTEYRTIEDIVKNRKSPLNNINLISGIIEIINLDEGIPISSAAHIHPSTNEELNRKNFDYDRKIAQMAEEIVLGNVLLVDVNDVDKLRGVNIEDEEPEERHAIMIYGFELDHKGTPIFHCFDHSIAHNHPIRISARDLMKNSSLSFLTVSRSDEERKTGFEPATSSLGRKRSTN